jgi:hypothetical protein
MTRDNWCIVRQMEEIPVAVFFEFYLEMGGVIRDYMSFSNYFSRMCSQEPNVYTKQSDYKKVTYGSCVMKLFQHYDTKFGQCLT